jgi:hypothetical protein
MSRDDFAPRNEEPLKERCAVGDICTGVCRDEHLEEYGLRCPAWFTDEMVRGKRPSGRR